MMDGALASTVCGVAVSISLPITVALIKLLPSRNGNGKARPVRCADVTDCRLTVDVAEMRSDQQHVAEGLQELKTQLQENYRQISESLRRLHERIDQRGDT